MTTSNAHQALVDAADLGEFLAAKAKEFHSDRLMACATDVLVAVGENLQAHIEEGTVRCKVDAMDRMRAAQVREGVLAKALHGLLLGVRRVLGESAPELDVFSKVDCDNISACLIGADYDGVTEGLSNLVTMFWAVMDKFGLQPTEHVDISTDEGLRETLRKVANRVSGLLTRVAAAELGDDSRYGWLGTELAEIYELAGWGDWKANFSPEPAEASSCECDGGEEPAA